MNDILHFQQLASTNTFLEQMLQSQNRAKTPDCPDGMIVMTDFQTTGRGRQTNSWHSERGKNLLMSILIYPHLPVEAQFRVTEWISLALADHLRQNVGLEPQIKWPNDIYINGKKIAGILISHHWHSNEIASSIIGIGLNLNQELFPDTLPNPTSVILENGKSSDLTETAIHIREQLSRLRKTDATSLHEQYQKLLYRRHVPALYTDTQSGETFEGVIEGVNNMGLLEIRSGNTLRNYELNGIVYS
ncbi:MAG: biotin--[Bacteroidales bacterium]|nr:biotin--[acetyl-CoA-carboxylase] ligase [Bacteroidales bacterium]